MGPEDGLTGTSLRSPLLNIIVAERRPGENASARIGEPQFLTAMGDGWGKLVALGGAKCLGVYEMRHSNHRTGWESDGGLKNSGRKNKNLRCFSSTLGEPPSFLFMLVSALMGRERMQAAYAHAIAQGYRFYSYGDSSLLLPR